MSRENLANFVNARLAVCKRRQSHTLRVRRRAPRLEHDRLTLEGSMQPPIPARRGHCEGLGQIRQH